MFPMTIVKKSGRAPSAGRAGSGKDYHLILITTADGRALYINRWAKKGQWGTGWLCDYYQVAADARDEFRRKHREKIEREYREILVEKEIKVLDEASLRKELGHQYVAAIGKERWAQLLPGADTSGMKDGQVDAEFELDAKGKWVRKERARKLVAEVPEPPQPIEDRIATNPNWGTWG